MTRDLLVGQLRLICATQRTIWPNPVAKGFQNASTLIVPLCVGISFEVGPEVSTVFKLHGRRRRRSSSSTAVRPSDVLRMRRAVPALPEHNTRHLSAVYSTGASRAKRTKDAVKGYLARDGSVARMWI